MRRKAEFDYQLNRVMLLDTFTTVCGYFTGHTEVNNGYGCLHPENTEKYEGDVIPRCYSFSCPLAYERHPDDPDNTMLVVRRTPEVAPLPVPHDGCRCEDIERSCCQPRPLAGLR